MIGEEFGNTSAGLSARDTVAVNLRFPEVASTRIGVEYPDIDTACPDHVAVITGTCPPERTPTWFAVYGIENVTVAPVAPSRIFEAVPALTVRIVPVCVMRYVGVPIISVPLSNPRRLTCVGEYITFHAYGFESAVPHTYTVPFDKSASFEELSVPISEV